MSEDRLRIIDELLRKGWQSYYDMAKAVYIKPDATEPYRYKDYYDRNRGAITQVFRKIQDIWAWAHYGEVLETGNDKARKSERRKAILNEIFEIKKQRQFPNGRVPELKQGNEYQKNPIVTFFRYKNPHYSLFDSGDYARYQSLHSNKNVKSLIDRSIKTAVTDQELVQSLYDDEVMLNEKVSDQIKRSIQIQKDLEVFESKSRELIGERLKEIAKAEEGKKQGWIRETINNYRVVLELARIPFSNVDRRNLARQIHEFAYFLASENQYHLLGDRFEEALDIYLKLLLEQRHLMEDYASGEEAIDLESIDPEAIHKQMSGDLDAVAKVLIHLARISLDSHKTDAAEKWLGKAFQLTGEEGSGRTRAEMFHLQGLLHRIKGDIPRAQSAIEEAFSIASLAGLEEKDLLPIKHSLAEIRLATGAVDEAERLFKETIDSYRAQVPSHSDKEGLAASLLGLASLHLFNGQLDSVPEEIDEALTLLKKLAKKEPDKHLPTLLTATYIKVLSLERAGQIAEALTLAEKGLAQYDQSRNTLKNLCLQEAFQLMLSLEDYYTSLGQTDKAESLAIRISSISKALFP